MTWEEKLAACGAIGDASLRMRKPGDWYVHHRGVEVKEGPRDVILRGLYGNGPTPEAAVEDHWRKLALLPPGHFVVLDAMGARRRHVRWNGYMWADVPEPAGAGGGA